MFQDIILSKYISNNFHNQHISMNHSFNNMVGYLQYYTLCYYYIYNLHNCLIKVFNNKQCFLHKILHINIRQISFQIIMDFLMMMFINNVNIILLVKIIHNINTLYQHNRYYLNIFFHLLQINTILRFLLMYNPLNTSYLCQIIFYQKFKRMLEDMFLFLQNILNILMYLK